jgi:transposase-like protein
MAKTRRQFSAEFKREAVNLAHCPGISVAQVAKELQVNAGVFRRWMRELETGTWEVEAGKP